MSTQQPVPFKVLLIGDSCIDEYHYGVVERLSPEAPVPILRHIDSVTKPGMAGNVESNLTSIGLDVFMMTNTKKPRKVRYIDRTSGQHLIRVDYDDFAEQLALIPFHSDVDAVVISDYCKGFLTYEAIEQIISLHTHKHIPVFIDTKKPDLKRFEGAIVKINSIEAKASTSQCSELIVTSGGSGATYKGKQYPGEQVEVFDVCGAGDTFLAALVYEYLLTTSLSSAILFANKAAAISVRHSGVYTLTKDDINEIRRIR